MYEGPQAEKQISYKQHMWVEKKTSFGADEASTDEGLMHLPVRMTTNLYF